MLSLEALFCHVDDFCRGFEPRWQQRLLAEGLQRRSRSRRLSLSEIMTILIAFHQSAYRNFKWFSCPIGLPLLAPSLSSISQLPALRGMDAIHPDSIVRLLAPQKKVIVLESALWIRRVSRSATTAASPPTRCSTP